MLYFWICQRRSVAGQKYRNGLGGLSAPPPLSVSSLSHQHHIEAAQPINGSLETRAGRTHQIPPHITIIQSNHIYAYGAADEQEETRLRGCERVPAAFRPLIFPVISGPFEIDKEFCNMLNVAGWARRSANTQLWQLINHKEKKMFEKVETWNICFSNVWDFLCFSFVVHQWFPNMGLGPP